jgi:hypothetical protein
LCNQVLKNLKRSAKLERFSRFTKSVYLQEGTISHGQVVGAKKAGGFSIFEKQVGKNISMKMMTTKRYG